MRKIVPVIVLFFLLCGVVGVKAEDTVGVTVSIEPLAYFAEKVGAEYVSVSVMIPAGASPHSYEPRPGQLKSLSSSDLYVKAGSGIEFELSWMGRLAALNKEMLICDSSRGIRLIPMAEHHNEDAGEHHRHGNMDPHIWLSPANAVVMVGNIRDCLIKVDPLHAEAYRRNAAELIMELQELRADIASRLASIESRTFLIFHPAWGYFAADFGLTQVAVEASGKEPTPRQLAEVVTQAKKLGARVVFASPQFSRRSAEVIAREIGGSVVMIDPLAKDYQDNLRKAAVAFEEGMKLSLTPDQRLCFVKLLRIQCQMDGLAGDFEPDGDIS